MYASPSHYLSGSELDQKHDIDTDFVALGHENAAWNVVRSELDNLLLEHAASCGAEVYENTKVISLEFDENDKPVSATYAYRSQSDTEHTVEGTITFRYLVDATGRAGLMSTKYLKNRNFMESLKNIAVWGYWAGVGTYGEGTARVGAPWFEALTGTNRSETQIGRALIQRTFPDESGWAWFIPLHTGLTSVGVVVDKETHARREKSRSDNLSRNTSPGNGVRKKAKGARGSLFHTLGTYLGFPRESSDSISPTVSLSTQRYMETLELAPGLKKLLGDGKLVDCLGTGNNLSFVHTASDYSYSSDRYSGDGWRVIGDAGGE